MQTQPQPQPQPQPLSLSCDDSYISLLLNPSTDQNHDSTDQIHDAQASLMPDDKFAEELQLQETIMASLITIQKTPNISTQTGESSTASSSSSSSPSSNAETSSKETGESSQTLCDICADRKDMDQMFPVQSCTHTFCTECITKHISIKIMKRTVLSDNSATIACPAGSEFCDGVLEFDSCRAIVPKDVVAMWDEVVTESLIPSSQRFYCPYKNCSALLVKDSGDAAAAVIREAECPFCNRLFCVQCTVPWHGGVTCEEFSKLSENEREREDLMVHELAKKNQWQRCPKCRYFVEKKDGCLHIKCRCGFQFCYKCGAKWSSTANHGAC